MAAKIDKHMSLTEAVTSYPEVGQYFAMAGMECFGCMAAQFEDIEQGCLAHGIDPDTFVRNLNFFLSKQDPTDAGLPQA